MEMKFETDWIELWQGGAAFSNLPHAHEQWMQVTLPVKGYCRFTQENRSYMLEQGGGIIQPPGAEHHFEIGQASSVMIMKVREQGEGGMSSLLPSFVPGTNHDIRHDFDSDEIVSRFKHWMLALMQGQTLADPAAVQEVESEVVAYVGGLIGVIAQDDARRRLAQPGAVADAHLRRAITYLHECYAQTINVDELAAIALQSRFHFIRSFREATGTTPYQYLLKLRMAEAMNRLRRSDAPIATISCDLGFSSTSQFHRAFQKMTGTTPQAFRLQ